MEKNEIITIEYVSDDVYNDYLKQINHTPITQSTYWAYLQENVSTRGKTFRFLAKKSNKICGACMLVLHKLDAVDVIGNNFILKKIFKNRCYLYAHRGPIFEDESTFDAILEESKKIAKMQNAIFIRFDPYILLSEKKDFFIKCEDLNLIKKRRYWNDFFTKKNFLLAHDQYQPLSTLILDINKPFEDILKQMSQTGRRNIRKSLASDLVFGYTTDINSDEFDQFIKIMDETTKRDGFLGHKRSYYEKIVDILGQKYGVCRLYFAKYLDKVLAAFIVTFFGDTATYYYGASSNDYRDKMPTFGLHWHIIQDMSLMGFKYYDFLGISPFYYQEKNVFKVEDEYGMHLFKSEEEAKNYVEKLHKFAKITQNKTRFGGYRIDVPPAYEYILNRFYYSILINLKKLRKNLRKIGVKI